MRIILPLVALGLISDSVHGFTLFRPPVVLNTNTRTVTKRHGLYSTATPTTGTHEKDGLVVGDTKGAVLLLEEVAISRGSNQIISNAELRIERGQRWGIVGANGAGKSTLLGCITGTVRKDSGKALVAPKVRVGYLRQTAVAGSNKTVFEEAASEMADINEAKAKMEMAETAITNGDTSDAMLIMLDEATSEFTAAGGWTQEQEVSLVLQGLGFQPEDSNRLCSEFSGGWQMRIALARLLLSKPNLLLLDEPSNHLDSSARDWLGKYLAAFDGSLVLVSHDISLLEASVNNIAEVTSGTLLTYVSCSYSRYLEEKEFRKKVAQAEYERNLAEAAHLQAFVDKWGASATKAASAQSRVKQIEKMRKEGKLTPPPAAVVQTNWKPSMILPDPPKAMGEILLSLNNANIGYDADGEPLLKNINFELRRGQKVILRGPNGAGKSTLMAALRGSLSLLSGERNENEKLRLGYFTQDLAQQLDKSARAVDLVTAYAREGKFGDITISDEDARSVMGRLGLTGEKSLRKVADLSGGEKARVALSMFALKASNVILLDEPSNHLDVECIEALSNALNNWNIKDGAIVVVSHDQPFCESVGFNTVGTVKDGSLKVEERALDASDWRLFDMTLPESNDKNASMPKELTPEEKEEQKRLRKLAYNAPKQIAKLEKSIEAAEAKLLTIEEEMLEIGTDVGRLVDFQKKKEKIEKDILKYEREWEELEEILASVREQ
jgi:ATPase subunit of ABC transporter with duplicated ATPase domains